MTNDAQTKGSKTMNATTQTSIDPRLQAVIMSASNPSDSGCLAIVLTVLGAASPIDREKLWTHFEKTIGHNLGSHVAKLRKVFNTIERELANDPSKVRLAAIITRGKAQEASQTVDGERGLKVPS
jgi:hypothetical protein